MSNGSGSAAASDGAGHQGPEVIPLGPRDNPDNRGEPGDLVDVVDPTGDAKPVDERRVEVVPPRQRFLAYGTGRSLI